VKLCTTAYIWEKIRRFLSKILQKSEDKNSAPFRVKMMTYQINASTGKKYDVKPAFSFCIKRFLCSEEISVALMLNTFLPAVPNRNKAGISATVTEVYQGLRLSFQTHAGLRLHICHDHLLA
jgi:hypothetical protein